MPSLIRVMAGISMLLLQLSYNNFRWCSTLYVCTILFKLSSMCPLRYAVSDTEHPPLLKF